MRFLKLLCIVLMAMLISAAFLSCSKSDDLVHTEPVGETQIPDAPSDNESSSITGLWSGKYFGLEKSIPVYLFFSIKEKGKLEVLNTIKKKTGFGTWVLTGNSFKAVYTIAASNKIYSFEGKLHSSPVRFIGTWGYDSSCNDGGIWDMTR